MTAYETESYRFACRSCGATHEVEFPIPLDVTSPARLDVRCPDCRTPNQGLRPGCEHPESGPAWLIDWADALCTFPENHGHGPGGVADD